LLIAVSKKVTRQHIYGMPTGSVIVRFGLSYPRIFILSAAKIMHFPELCKNSIIFLQKAIDFAVFFVLLYRVS